MVTSDPVEADAARRAGQRVVLIVAEDSPLATGAVPGSVALLVGDPAGPATVAAAEEMAAELYRR